MKSGLVLNKIRKVSRLGEFKVSEALNRFEFNIKMGNGINLECYGLNLYLESTNFGIKTVNDNVFQNHGTRTEPWNQDSHFRKKIIFEFIIYL